MSPGRTVPAPALARQTAVPLHHLNKVLHQLCAASLIVGRRGLRGGYTLTRPASQIRLTDVVRATQGPARRVERPPEHSDAALEGAIESIASLLAKELDRHTIESVLHPPGTGNGVLSDE